MLRIRPLMSETRLVMETGLGAAGRRSSARFLVLRFLRGPDRTSRPAIPARVRGWHGQEPEHGYAPGPGSGRSTRKLVELVAATAPIAAVVPAVSTDLREATAAGGRWRAADITYPLDCLIAPHSRVRRRRQADRGACVRPRGWRRCLSVIAVGHWPAELAPAGPSETLCAPEFGRRNRPAHTRRRPAMRRLPRALVVYHRENLPGASWVRRMPSRVAIVGLG